MAENRGGGSGRRRNPQGGSGSGGSGGDRRRPPRGDGRSGRPGGKGRPRDGGGRDDQRPSGGRGGRPRAGDTGTDRDRGGGRRGDITLTAGGDLPRWVREEVTRSTPKDRREPALIELTAGLAAYADERYGQAASALRKAKAMSPRAATVREVLGLSTYQSEAWEEALRELRTFRRIAGDTSHMPVELDCLRAMGRHRDIEKTWELYGELGGSPETDDEMRVVYASHLLDEGRTAEAWQVVKPGRLVANPPPSALRRWAVAARVAAAGRDRKAVDTLLAAIRKAEPEIEWLADLEAQLDF